MVLRLARPVEFTNTIVDGPANAIKADIEGYNFVGDEMRVPYYGFAIGSPAPGKGGKGYQWESEVLAGTPALGPTEVGLKIIVRLYLTGGIEIAYSKFLSGKALSIRSTISHGR